MQGTPVPAGPQPAGTSGGDLLVQNQMQQNPWMGAQKPPMGGQPPMGRPPMGRPPMGQPRAPMAGGGMGRRAFMKIMAGLASIPLIGKGVSKVAPKAIKETTEVITRGADGMPTYITDLIEVVKAKGIKKIVDSDINKYPDTLHSYKGVDVTEDSLGNIKIKNDRSGMATDSTTGKTHEGIVEEHHMQIERGQMNVKDEGLETQKGFQEPDEYIEGTVRPDMDGKMKDFEEGLDEDVHEFFKEIADEIGDVYYEDVNITGKLKRPKKASGGLAYALGE